MHFLLLWLVMVCHSPFWSRGSTLNLLNSGIVPKTKLPYLGDLTHVNHSITKHSIARNQIHQEKL